MDLYNMLCESDTHLRQPVRLETQLLKLKTMDAEVGQSMLQLLQASSLYLSRFSSKPCRSTVAASAALTQEQTSCTLHMQHAHVDKQS